MAGKLDYSLLNLSEDTILALDKILKRLKFEYIKKPNGIWPFTILCKEIFEGKNDHLYREYAKIFAETGLTNLGNEMNGNKTTLCQGLNLSGSEFDSFANEWTRQFESNTKENKNDIPNQFHQINQIINNTGEINLAGHHSSVSSTKSEKAEKKLKKSSIGSIIKWVAIVIGILASFATIISYINAK